MERAKYPHPGCQVFWYYRECQIKACRQEWYPTRSTRIHNMLESSWWVQCDFRCAGCNMHRVVHINPKKIVNASFVVRMFDPFFTDKKCLERFGHLAIFFYPIFPDQILQDLGFTYLWVKKWERFLFSMIITVCRRLWEVLFSPIERRILQDPILCGLVVAALPTVGW